MTTERRMGKTGVGPGPDVPLSFNWEEFRIGEQEAAKERQTGAATGWPNAASTDATAPYSGPSYGGGGGGSMDGATFVLALVLLVGWLIYTFWLELLILTGVGLAVMLVRHRVAVKLWLDKHSFTVLVPIAAGYRFIRSVFRRWKD